MTAECLRRAGATGEWGYEEANEGGVGGSSDNQLDAFGTLRGINAMDRGVCKCGWELGAGMMEAASGFVDLYHRAFNLSLLFPARCT